MKAATFSNEGHGPSDLGMVREQTWIVRCGIGRGEVSAVLMMVQSSGSDPAPRWGSCPVMLLFFELGEHGKPEDELLWGKPLLDSICWRPARVGMFLRITCACYAVDHMVSPRTEAVLCEVRTRATKKKTLW